ncbi:MAG: type II toxin-antitoxin system RelE/ParE family toxin [Candidatus Omnitrophica bacterium]|nr:type II toxin-antitoxin system RelE/ParE family toxin [Candidatus Omnitrophota bacterium]
MGKYKIEIKRSAVKEIQQIPPKDLKKILNKIESLSGNPRPFGCRKLSAEEKYRIRYGSYRILYMIEDNVLIVYVVKVGQRKDVYR